MKFLMTASLLNSYKYYIENECADREDFISTLIRKKTPQTFEQMRGNQFENLVYSYAEGIYVDPNHEWIKGIQPMGERLKGAQFQVALSKDIMINGVQFVLYGILDALRNGEIFDVKTTKNYAPTRTAGKFWQSPQTAAYFSLVPEARSFEYLIYDFDDVIYSEKYYREDVKPITAWMQEFMQFLDRANLVDVYARAWRSKYD